MTGSLFLDIAIPLGGIICAVIAVAYMRHERRRIDRLMEGGRVKNAH